VALDTFSVVWNEVIGYVPLAGPLLAQNWVKRAFRQVAERRRWSWLWRYGQFIIPAVYNTGTVTVTLNSATVTGSGTAWTSAMIGRQFRTSVSSPIYTITAVASGISMTIEAVWGSATAGGQSYEIWQAYVTAPSDFHAFIAVWDPRLNWQLHLNIAQETINDADAQRSNSGNAYLLSPWTYDTTSPPLPRFELWPHQKAAYVYPFLYEARPTDISDAAATLPRYIRGDLLIETALAMAARWPGPSKDNPNPYFSIQLASMHDARAERMIAELERQDEETNMQEFSYPPGMAPWPFFDAAWLQRHAI